MTEYTGTNKNIQRKIRRAWDYMVTHEPLTLQAVPGGLLPTLLKAIFIALDEDYTDNVTAGEDGILIDLDLESPLDPVPYDKEV